MDPLLRDSLYLFYCFTMTIVCYLLHSVIRDFIRSKPEGKITAVAKIHVHASYGLQFYTTTRLVFPCIRITFGFFPLTGVIIKEYIQGVSWIVTNVFFAYAAAVKTGYMISFGWLSGVSESKILRVMTIIATVWTTSGFTLDLLWKWYHDRFLLERSRMLAHLFYGGMDIMDKQTESINATWFGLGT